jgi:hypothetical protein
MLSSNHRIRRYIVPALMVVVLSGALAPQAVFAQHRSGGYGHDGGHGREWGRGWGYGGGVFPAVATLLTIGALTYWVEADPYYRTDPWGTYVVVPPTQMVAPAQVMAPTLRISSDRLFVYPSQAQSTEKQASDEYDCHRWAVAQTGVDPVASAAATPIDFNRRQDYLRAQAACLEGRGYTVR